MHPVFALRITDKILYAHYKSDHTYHTLTIELVEDYLTGMIASRFFWSTQPFG